MAATSICSINGCGKFVLARDMCAMHYARWRKHGDPLIGARKVTLLCSVDGCGRPHLSRGFCSRHWIRWRKYGSPLSGRTENGEPERFLKEIALRHNSDECLHWPFYRNPQGYGLISCNGKSTLVTRIVCEAANGPPPSPHHEAAHSCGNGNDGCCAKRHLIWKTHAENMADTILHGTSGRGEQHAQNKLDSDQVRQIRRIFTKGSVANLADQFGVSEATIYDIVNRRSWKWLD